MKSKVKVTLIESYSGWILFVKNQQLACAIETEQKTYLFDDIQTSSLQSFVNTVLKLNRVKKDTPVEVKKQNLSRKAEKISFIVA